MTFLLDQGLPRSTTRELAARGFAAIHVAELGRAAATDGQILLAARNRDAVVVTLDADFHAILAASRATAPSVVRIRIENLKAPRIADIIEWVATIAAADLAAGAAISVTRGRIGIRLLPLV